MYICISIFCTYRIHRFVPCFEYLFLSYSKCISVFVCSILFSAILISMICAYKSIYYDLLVSQCVESLWLTHLHIQIRPRPLLEHMASLFIMRYAFFWEVRIESQDNPIVRRESTIFRSNSYENKKSFFYPQKLWKGNHFFLKQSLLWIWSFKSA